MKRESDRFFLTNGFDDPELGSQQAFRAMVKALDNPGRFFQIKEAAKETWEDVSEKILLEMLATRFDRLTPVLSIILRGKEIVTAHESYRRISLKEAIWQNYTLNIIQFPIFLIQSS